MFCIQVLYYQIIGYEQSTWRSSLLWDTTVQCTYICTYVRSPWLWNICKYNRKVMFLFCRTLFILEWSGIFNLKRLSKSMITVWYQCSIQFCSFKCNMLLVMKPRLTLNINFRFFCLLSLFLSSSYCRHKLILTLLFFLEENLYFHKEIQYNKQILNLDLL